MIASFNNPYSITIDWINSPEIIYAADSGNYCIRKINQTSSLVSTFAGICSSFVGYQNGPLLSSLFNAPNSIRYLSSSSGTKLLVADRGNNVIRMIDMSLGLFIKNKIELENSFKSNKKLKNFRNSFNPGWKWVCWIS